MKMKVQNSAYRSAFFYIHTMKYKLLILSFFFTCIVFSQNEDRKAYMYDENGTAIDEKTFFEKLRSGIYYKRAVVNDTAVLAKLYVRKFEGKLDASSYKKFVSYLEKTVKTKIDTTKIVVIYFFYENDKRVTRHYATTKRLEALNNNDAVQAFYMTEKGFRFKNRKHVFYEDIFNLAKQTFFETNVCCGSAVILKPDGTYYKELEEFSATTISEKALSDR